MHCSFWKIWKRHELIKKCIQNSEDRILQKYFKLSKNATNQKAKYVCHLSRVTFYIMPCLFTFQWICDGAEKNSWICSALSKAKQGWRWWIRGDFILFIKCSFFSKRFMKIYTFSNFSSIFPLNFLTELVIGSI